MEIIDSSKILIISEINNNKEIYLPYNREGIRANTTSINGRSYYKKMDDFYHIINELIGTYLSMQLNLDSVINKLGLHGDTLYVLSELFYKKGHKYFYPYESLPYITCEEFRSKRWNFLDKNEDALPILDDNMLVKMLKLIAIDLKMGQTDRNGTNITLEWFGNKIDFAPFYDYGSSYNTAQYYTRYKNSFITIKKDEKSLKEFIKKYPLFMEFLSIIRKLEIDDIIENIEDINGIKLFDEEKKHYKEKDQIYSKMLTKL